MTEDLDLQLEMVSSERWYNTGARRVFLRSFVFFTFPWMTLNPKFLIFLHKKMVILNRSKIKFMIPVKIIFIQASMR